MINMRVVRENAKSKCGISCIDEHHPSAGLRARVGGAVGAAVGVTAGTVTALFTKERRIWKNAIAKEKEIRNKIKVNPKSTSLRIQLKQAINAKNKALRSYHNARSTHRFVGGAVGAVAGGVAGLAS